MTIGSSREMQGFVNRVLFGVRENRVCILAASFVKKTRKTPAGVIEPAHKRLAVWR